MVRLDYKFLDRFPLKLLDKQLQRTIIKTKIKMVIIKLLKYLHQKLSFEILFITHNIQSVKSLCEYVAIIKSGKIIEKDNLLKVILNQQQDHTKMLIQFNFAYREFRK